MSSQRLFAAVLLPEPAADELARAVAPLRELPGAVDLRWTARAGWHYTLAFLGNVDEELLPELYTRLERAAHRTEPFPLRIHGGGRFDGRAFWAGAGGGLDTLRLLAKRAHAAARKAGVPMEEHRHYTPHLTLARSRDQADLTPYTAGLEGFEGMRWEAGELSLVRSNLPVDGVPGSSRGTRWCGPGCWDGERAGYARRVDPKTRNRVMAAVLVLMFVVVAAASALGG